MATHKTNSKLNTRSKSVYILNFHVLQSETHRNHHKKSPNSFKLNLSRAKSSENRKILYKILFDENFHQKHSEKRGKPKSISHKTGESLLNFLSIEKYLKIDPIPETRESKNEKINNQHIKSSFFALKALRNVEKPPIEKIRSKQIVLPNIPSLIGRKTVIFDLDETLVHCVGSSPGQITLPITFPSGKKCNAGINLRPFLAECLSVAASLFEVIIFTASHRCYADVIIDHIDPKHELVHHRLYRENCVNVNSFNVKDLRIFANRRIQDLVIIDNSIFSFAFNLDNGVPIISWFDNQFDVELKELIEYFYVIADTDDVREVNRQIFHLDTFYDDYYHQFTSK